MATLRDITIKTSEYRPCIIEGKKALFHRWEEVAKVIPPSPMVGGHNGGIVKMTLGIIELEDGVVTEVYPHKIRFCGTQHNEYCFETNK